MSEDGNMQVPDAQVEATSVEKYEGGRAVEFDLGLFEGFDASSVKVEAVEPIDRQFGRYGGRCLLLRNIITEQECQYLIREMSTDMEPVQYRHDYRRNDRCVFDSPELAEILWERVRPTAESLAVHAYDEPRRQRLLSEEETGSQPEEGSCPEELQLQYGQEGIWRATGLNECLRFCRYTPGGFFRAHCDANFRRTDEEQSLFTCMFYLDSQMEGGATRFMRIDGVLTQENYLKLASDDQVLASVAPEQGLCVLFFQPGLLHEGEDLRGGVKHILRTDVMFRRDPDTKPQLTPRQAEALSLLRQAEAAEASHECDRAAQLYRRAFKLDPRLERIC
mmetsp:Transcript_16670/g.37540  ORF Transcript_16670/g.37540 Transcript_16670/m.37540 type:complete len:335 (-) Transcript_16670:121-1125(-)